MEDWIGGDPARDTFVERVHRSTAHTILEVEVPPIDDAQRAEVEASVAHQMQAMAAHVKFGVAVVAVFVTLHALATTGKPPWKLDLDARQRLVTRWANSPLAPVAQYVRLLRTLVLFAAFEHPSRAALVR